MCGLCVSLTEGVGSNEIFGLHLSANNIQVLVNIGHDPNSFLLKLCQRTAMFICGSFHNLPFLYIYRFKFFLLPFPRVKRLFGHFLVLILRFFCNKYEMINNEFDAECLIWHVTSNCKNSKFQFHICDIKNLKWFVLNSVLFQL